MPVPVLMSVPVSVDGSLMTCESAFLARGHARKTHTLLLSMSMSVFFVTVAVFFVTMAVFFVTMAVFFVTVAVFFVTVAVSFAMTFVI